MSRLRRLVLGCLLLSVGAACTARGSIDADGGTGGAMPAGGATGASGGADATGGATTGGAGGTGGLPGTGGAVGSTGSGGQSGSAGGGGGSTPGGTTGMAGHGAAGGNANAGNVGMPGDPAGWVPALVGVGYGGIRIVSRDGGKTWGDRVYETTNGGDDDVLLRAVAYGKGLWVATGWKLWTSTDGLKWTDHGMLKNGPISSCSIVEGLAFDDGTFFAACTPWNTPGTIYRSTDGVTWTKHSTIGDTGGHLYLTHRGGTFVAYGDTKTSFQSSDAMTWTVMSGIEKATYCADTWKSETDCKDSSWYDGVYLRADWQGKVARSTNGTSFSTVYNDDQKNTLYQSRAIAAGFVAPK